MKLNQHTAVVTPKVLLVPYEAHHVPTYHEWMKSEELQELTASEPLSIEAEFDMQKSWRKDGNKLTFIVCRTPLLGIPKSDNGVFQERNDAPAFMIGDVNLFLSTDYGVDGNGEEDMQKPFVKGEIELMIAEAKDRGRGYGRATLLAFLRYLKKRESDIVEAFLPDEVPEEKERAKYEARIDLGVKIGEDNKTSRSLFQSVGFEQVGEPNYFREVEFRLLDWKRVEEVEGWRETRYISEVERLAMPGAEETWGDELIQTKCDCESHSQL